MEFEVTSMLLREFIAYLQVGAMILMVVSNWPWLLYHEKVTELLAQDKRNDDLERIWNGKRKAYLMGVRMLKVDSQEPWVKHIQLWFRIGRICFVVVVLLTIFQILLSRVSTVRPGA